MALKLISTFTAAGIGIAKQALSGDAKITFTRAAASVADWSQKTADELRGATKLDDEAQAVDISGIKTVTGDDGKASNDLIELEVTFPQAKIKEDYALRTVGLFAAPVVDGKQGAEVLYNVTTFDQPEWILQDSKGSEFKLKIATIVGDIEALTVVLPNGDTGGLTQDELDLFHTQLTKEYDTKYQPVGHYATSDDIKDMATNAGVDSKLKKYAQNGALSDMETKTDAKATYQQKGDYAQADNTVTTDGNQVLTGAKMFANGIEIPDIPSGTSANSIIKTGLYKFITTDTSAADEPFGQGTPYFLMVISSVESVKPNNWRYITQIGYSATSYFQNPVLRTTIQKDYSKDPTWSAWTQLVTGNQLNDLTKRVAALEAK